MPGRVDQHAAPGELDELARRRRVPAALVVAQSADGLHLAAEQAVRQRRFADARRADEADRLAGADVARAARRAPSPDAALARTTGTPIAARPMASSIGARSASRSTLFSTMTGSAPLFHTARHVALEPSLVEVAVHGRHDEEHVDVDGDDLRLGERAGGAPQQRRASLEHVLNRRAIDAVDDRDPIADDRTLELTERAPATRPLEIAERRAAARNMKAALPFRDDARGHPMRRARAARAAMAKKSSKPSEASVVKRRESAAAAAPIMRRLRATAAPLRIGTSLGLALPGRRSV